MIAPARASPGSVRPIICCCVLDAYARRIVGRDMDRRCETPLVNGAVLSTSA